MYILFLVLWLSNGLIVQHQEPVALSRAALASFAQKGLAYGNAEGDPKASSMMQNSMARNLMQTYQKDTGPNSKIQEDLDAKAEISLILRESELEEDTDPDSNLKQYTDPASMMQKNLKSGCSTDPPCAMPDTFKLKTPGNDPLYLTDFSSETTGPKLSTVGYGTKTPTPSPVKWSMKGFCGRRRRTGTSESFGKFKAKDSGKYVHVNLEDNFIALEALSISSSTQKGSQWKLIDVTSSNGVCNTVRLKSKRKNCDNGEDNDCKFYLAVAANSLRPTVEEHATETDAQLWTVVDDD